MRTQAVCLALALTLTFACHNRSPGNGSPILARVGDNVITVHDLEARIASFGRAKSVMDEYSRPERKKELLTSLIAAETLYQEARRLGYDRDPVVKREAVNRMLQNEVESQVKVETISDAEVDKYFAAHPNEFSRPDQVRLTQIVMKDHARALKVAAQAKALPKGNSEALRALVDKYSEDAPSRGRGGDLGMVERTTSSLPKPVVEAAFALGQINEVSDPIATERGWTIVVLIQKLPGFSRSLAEAKSGIQLRLLAERRQQKRAALTSEIRQRAKVEIDETQLADWKPSPSAMGTSGASAGERGGSPPVRRTPGSPPGPPSPAAPGRLPQ